MLKNPVVRLAIHAAVAGALAAFTAYQVHPGDTHGIIVAFIGTALAFAGYGTVSPTYKGVGIGKDPS